MTPKADFFGRIEDYCLDLLSVEEKLEFEKELEFNDELRREVELHKNLQAAILETDILDLRNKLNSVDSELKNQETGSTPFDLLDALSEIKNETDELTSEDLIDNYESLPKVHVYQHERTSNENLHEFYKEQNEEEILSDEELEMMDIENLDGLEEAILETDILNLRDSLQQVSKSIEPQYSTEEIDEFLNGELDESILAEFETELDSNEMLQSEVDLHKGIEAAVNENDVMDLRSEMRNIMNTETSWNVSEESIEDFIDGMLEEDIQAEFMDELSENTDLAAEVNLREQINAAIGEEDIMNLRAGLQDAKHQAEEQENKAVFMPKFEPRSFKFWRNSVAVVVVAVGLAGAVNSGFVSVDNTYDKYFETPTWASERSVSNSLDDIQLARTFYQGKEYDKVIELLDKVEANENEAFVVHFYKGLSYQNLEEYPKANKEYSMVLKHGNNLFIEEAQWYRALCLVKMDDDDKAKQELLAVIERRGHYHRDAKAILRKLRFSFK